MSRAITYRLFAAAFLAATVYHLIGATGLAFHEVPQWRHALWIPIDGFMAWGFWGLQPWLGVPLVVITAWSFYSHGWLAFLEWRSTGRFDWPSLAVIVLLPAMLARVICDTRANRSLAVR